MQGKIITFNVYKIHSGLKNIVDDDSIFSCHCHTQLFSGGGEGGMAVAENNANTTSLVMSLQTFETTPYAHIDLLNLLTSGCPSHVFHGYKH